MAFLYFKTLFIIYKSKCPKTQLDKYKIQVNKVFFYLYFIFFYFIINSKKYTKNCPKYSYCCSFYYLCVIFICEIILIIIKIMVFMSFLNKKLLHHIVVMIFLKTIIKVIIAAFGLNITENNIKTS